MILGEQEEEWKLQLVDITSWAIDIIVIFASIRFLLGFRKVREKSYGLKIILILILSDLGVPIMNTILQFFPVHLELTTYHAIGVGIFRFSLYWSGVLAAFTLKIVASQGEWNQKFYVRTALLLCMILSLFCPALVLFHVCNLNVLTLGIGYTTIAYLTDNLYIRLLGWTLYDTVGILTPCLIILNCYWRILNTMKSYAKILPVQRIRTFRLVVYMLIPIICFVPTILVDLLNVFIPNTYPFALLYIITTIRRSWAFLNLLAYWFLNPQSSTSILSDNTTEIEA